MPFWAFLWPGGYAITRCILDGSIQLRGHVVVDIGSGCASASIGAKMQGAALVIANDIDPFACGVSVFSRLLPSVPLYKWGGFVQIFPLKSGGVFEPPPPLEWAGFGRLSLRGKTPPL